MIGAQALPHAVTEDEPLNPGSKKSQTYWPSHGNTQSRKPIPDTHQIFIVHRREN